jgi:hypothetical protein
MAAVLHPGGSLILTFPHRHDYFAGDDRFVNHYRRYELEEMEQRLRDVGLNPVEIRKVLGPLEKVTMILMTSIISGFQRTGGHKVQKEKPTATERVFLPVFKWLNRLYCLPVRFDNWVAPRFLSAVLLVRSVKTGEA